MHLHPPWHQRLRQPDARRRHLARQRGQVHRRRLGQPGGVQPRQHQHLLNQPAGPVAALQRALKRMAPFLVAGCPERHLGLLPAAEIADLDARIERMADALAATPAAELPPAAQYGAMMRVLAPEILTPASRSGMDVLQPFTDTLAACDASALLDRVMYVDLKTSLPEQLLLLTDKMSMACSLEVRVPYLDYRVVEFAARLPDGRTLTLGATIGVAVSPADGRTWQALLARADERMYAGKRSGRGRVVVA